MTVRKRKDFSKIDDAIIAMQGVEDEAKAYTDYMERAKDAKDPKLKETLIDVAEEEIVHLGEFAKRADDATDGKIKKLMKEGAEEAGEAESKKKSYAGRQRKIFPEVNTVPTKKGDEIDSPGIHVEDYMAEFGGEGEIETEVILDDDSDDDKPEERYTEGSTKEEKEDELIDSQITPVIYGNDWNVSDRKAQPPRHSMDEVVRYVEDVFGTDDEIPEEGTISNEEFLKKQKEAITRRRRKGMAIDILKRPEDLPKYHMLYAISALLTIPDDDFKRITSFEKAYHIIPNTKVGFIGSLLNGLKLLDTYFTGKKKGSSTGEMEYPDKDPDGTRQFFNDILTVGSNLNNIKLDPDHIFDSNYIEKIEEGLEVGYAHVDPDQQKENYLRFVAGDNNSFNLPTPVEIPTKLYPTRYLRSVQDGGINAYYTWKEWVGSNSSNSTGYDAQWDEEDGGSQEANSGKKAIPHKKYFEGNLSRMKARDLAVVMSVLTNVEYMTNRLNAMERENKKKEEKLENEKKKKQEDGTYSGELSQDAVKKEIEDTKGAIRTWRYLLNLDSNLSEGHLQGATTPFRPKKLDKGGSDDYIFRRIYRHNIVPLVQKGKNGEGSWKIDNPLLESVITEIIMNKNPVKYFITSDKGQLIEDAHSGRLFFNESEIATLLYNEIWRHKNHENAIVQLLPNAKKNVALAKQILKAHTETKKVLNTKTGNIVDQTVYYPLAADYSVKEGYKHRFIPVSVLKMLEQYVSILEPFVGAFKNKITYNFNFMDLMEKDEELKKKFNEIDNLDLWTLLSNAPDLFIKDKNGKLSLKMSDTPTLKDNTRVLRSNLSKMLEKKGTSRSFIPEIEYTTKDEGTGQESTVKVPILTRGLEFPLPFDYDQPKTTGYNAPLLQLNSLSLKFIAELIPKILDGYINQNNNLDWMQDGVAVLANHLIDQFVKDYGNRIKTGQYIGPVVSTQLMQRVVKALILANYGADADKYLKKVLTPDEGLHLTVPEDEYDFTDDDAAQVIKALTRFKIFKNLYAQNPISGAGPEFGVVNTGEQLVADSLGYNKVDGTDEKGRPLNAVAGAEEIVSRFLAKFPDLDSEKLRDKLREDVIQFNIDNKFLEDAERKELEDMIYKLAGKYKPNGDIYTVSELLHHPDIVTKEELYRYFGEMDGSRLDKMILRRQFANSLEALLFGSDASRPSAGTHNVEVSYPKDEDNKAIATGMMSMDNFDVDAFNERRGANISEGLLQDKVYRNYIKEMSKSPTYVQLPQKGAHGEADRALAALEIEDMVGKDIPKLRTYLRILDELRTALKDKETGEINWDNLGAWHILQLLPKLAGEYDYEGREYGTLTSAGDTLTEGFFTTATPADKLRFILEYLPVRDLERYLEHAEEEGYDITAMKKYLNAIKLAEQVFDPNGFNYEGLNIKPGLGNNGYVNSLVDKVFGEKRKGVSQAVLERQAKRFEDRLKKKENEALLQDDPLMYHDYTYEDIAYDFSVVNSLQEKKMRMENELEPIIEELSEDILLVETFSKLLKDPDRQKNAQEILSELRSELSAEENKVAILDEQIKEVAHRIATAVHEGSFDDMVGPFEEFRDLIPGDLDETIENMIIAGEANSYDQIIHKLNELAIDRPKEMSNYLATMNLLQGRPSGLKSIYTRARERKEYDDAQQATSEDKEKPAENGKKSPKDLKRNVLTNLVHVSEPVTKKEEKVLESLHVELNALIDMHDAIGDKFEELPSGQVFGGILNTSTGSIMDSTQFEEAHDLLLRIKKEFNEKGDKEIAEPENIKKYTVMLRDVRELLKGVNMIISTPGISLENSPSEETHPSIAEDADLSTAENEHDKNIQKEHILRELGVNTDQRLIPDPETHDPEMDERLYEMGKYILVLKNKYIQDHKDEIDREYNRYIGRGLAHYTEWIQRATEHYKEYIIDMLVKNGVSAEDANIRMAKFINRLKKKVRRKSMKKLRMKAERYAYNSVREYVDSLKNMPFNEVIQNYNIAAKKQIEPVDDLLISDVGIDDARTVNDLIKIYNKTHVRTKPEMDMTNKPLYPKWQDYDEELDKILDYLADAYLAQNNYKLKMSLKYPLPIEFPEYKRREEYREEAKKILGEKIMEGLKSTPTPFDDSGFGDELYSRIRKPMVDLAAAVEGSVNTPSFEEYNAILKELIKLAALTDEEYSKERSTVKLPFPLNGVELPETPGELKPLIDKIKLARNRSTAKDDKYGKYLNKLDKLNMNKPRNRRNHV